MFDEAMASHAAAIIPAVLDSIDLNGCRVIADIGGGTGHVLTAILERRRRPVRAALPGGGEHVSGAAADVGHHSATSSEGCCRGQLG